VTGPGVNVAALSAPLLGFALTLVLVRVLVPKARRYGMVDRPAAGRKDSGSGTPTIGGLAIVAGLALTGLLAQFASQVHPAFWAGLCLIALTGTLDDLFDLQPTIKFAAQIAAALLMVYWGGLQLHTLGKLVSDQPLLLGHLTVPLTVFAVIGVVNAINLCDGADGLGGGLVFIAVFWIALMSALSSSTGTLELSLGMLGCIAAFLAHNMRSPWRSRAAVFLGDAGSLSLGFALAWLTVSAAQPQTPLFAPVPAIWLVAIPISDTIVCMSRRLLKGQNPFRADRTHLHHILIDLGMSVGAAVALIHLIAFVLAAAGVAGWALQVQEHHMFYTAMAVFALYILLVQIGLHRVSAAQMAGVHKI
jgi:UDP-GlcNAc:undecaprenyl-phosphate GlcNAc-1-phosphate transferase